MSRLAKKAVLATFGTLGDIYPFIAIAFALEHRGFDITIVAPDTHQRSIEDEGLSYARLRPSDENITAALGVDIRGAFEMMLKNSHFILDEIYMRFLHETFEDVVSAASGADVIFTHSLLVGASQAAEALRIPAARVALAPLHLQSAASPSLTPGAPYRLEPNGYGAISYNRVVRSVVRAVTRARMGKLRRFRAEVELPSTGEDFFLDFGRANTADAVFGLFSPRFSPVQCDHPKNLIAPGFAFHRSRDPKRCRLDAGLERFLDAGEPPVVFTLGSFAPEVSDTFYDRSMDASRALGLRCVLLAGDANAVRLASLVTAREFVCARAPHSLLFPRAFCVVHHGGIGTTAEAARAAKPQIIVPFFGDQPDHAARVARLGLGLSVALASYRVDTATKALRDVIYGQYADNARAFAQLIAGEAGVDALAAWAEGMVRVPTNPQLNRREMRDLTS